MAAQIPDEPLNLQNDPSITDAYQIGLTWEAPTFDGGSPVIDYKVWYDNGSGSTFEELAVNIAELTYTATGLTQGVTYKFRV